jgi:hypothetical protein
MLVITGILDNDRFFPDTPVAIPKRQRVKVLIEEAQMDTKTYAQKWKELGEAITACDEALSDWPIPVQFRSPEAVEAL